MQQPVQPLDEICCRIAFSMLSRGQMILKCSEETVVNKSLYTRGNFSVINEQNYGKIVMVSKALKFEFGAFSLVHWRRKCPRRVLPSSRSILDEWHVILFPIYVTERTRPSKFELSFIQSTVSVKKAKC